MNNENSNFEDLIELMGHPLKSKKTSAIKQFKEKKYPVSSLIEYLDPNNDNFYSSFIQLSSDGTFEDQVVCWDMFEKYYYQIYTTDDVQYDKKFIHIKCSLNKYFFKSGKIEPFFHHIENLNKKIITHRRICLLQAKKEDDDSFFYSVFMFNNTFKPPSEYDKDKLTEEEFSNLCQFSNNHVDRNLLKYMSPDIQKMFSYFYLLKDSFLYFFYTETNREDILYEIIHSNRIVDMIGLDNPFQKKVQNGAQEKLDLLNPKSKIDTLISDYKSTEDLNEKINKLVELTFFNKKSKSKKDDFIKSLFKSLQREFYQFLLESYKKQDLKQIIVDYCFLKANILNFSSRFSLDFLSLTESKEHFLYVLNLTQSIETLLLKNDLKWQDEYLKLVKFLIFDQNEVLYPSLTNVNNIFFYYPLTVENTYKYKSILLDYLKKHRDDYKSFCNESYNEFDKMRFFFTMKTLLRFGDLETYNLAKEVYLFSKEHPIDPPTNNYFSFYLNEFIDARNNRIDRKDLFIDIGIKWEKICNRIASEKYGNILSEFKNETRLINNKIPDIILDHDVKYSESFISHADTIIECKSSLYFTNIGMGGGQSLVNNKDSQYYLPYCNNLEFWVLEGYDNLINFEEYEKITYIFSKDFLEDKTISEYIKTDISNLLSTKETIRNLPKATPDELFTYIDNFVL